MQTDKDLKNNTDGKNGQTKVMVVILLLLAVMVAGAGTFAWFTFNSRTNVTPLEGKITEGATVIVTSVQTIQLEDELNLSISNNYDGPFSTTCELIFDCKEGDFSPISTANLSKFFIPAAQNTDGISVRFKNAGDETDLMCMHGKVYLLMEGQSGNVFFDKESLGFDGDVQLLASLRLGLKITTPQGTSTAIYNLDGLSDTSGAEVRKTVSADNSVISGTDGSGSPVFTADPSKDITEFFAGKTPVLRLEKDQKAEVEYWVYMEGCDENCHNSVMDKDLELKLGFGGERDGE